MEITVSPNINPAWVLAQIKNKGGRIQIDFLGLSRLLSINEIVITRNKRLMTCDRNPACKIPHDKYKADDMSIIFK